MNTAGQKFTVSHDSPLLKYLYEIFPTQSKTGVKNMLSKGQVLVNGERRTAFDHPLRAGDTLLILAKVVSMARESSENAREEVERTGVQPRCFISASWCCASCCTPFLSKSCRTG